MGLTSPQALTLVAYGGIPEYRKTSLSACQRFIVAALLSSLYWRTQQNFFFFSFFFLSSLTKRRTAQW